ncbi:MAG TPA: nickel-dependent hydrogenase large subunit [Blastocatellia bacterium]|nr:nickel-dependent hydrogenase large subunit [Blastocatellia bacterium]
MCDEKAEAPFNFVEADRLRQALNRERALEELIDQPSVWNFSIDPLTRSTSSLTLQTQIDLQHRRVLDARVEMPQFCGGELILRDRVAADAPQITSRASGSGSGAQAIASSLALEMAAGIAPPPLAIIARNLGACGELLSEGARHLFLFAGPDYSEAAVSRTSLSIWGQAQLAPAPGVHLHGLETIADIMRGMNPMSGHLYLEALQMSRLGLEIAALIFGKYPHPSTIFPGGVGIEASRERFNQILGRINYLLDYAKKVVAVWDDLVEFFYEVEPRYRRVGELPGNLLSAGIWDDPEHYDATYRNCNEWGARRLATPGVIINNQRRTTRLSDLNLGIEEFIDHSYYAPWEHQQFSADPLDGPLSPWHPWNKETIPRPAPREWRGRYTWNTAPRWDREPMETGPIARLWVAALSLRQNCEFIGRDRRGLEIVVPKGQRPAVRLRWRIPERPNALERNRARAYQLAYAGMVGYASLLDAFARLRRGEQTMSERFSLPESAEGAGDPAIGVGFWEGGNGAVIHYVVAREQSIGNYQLLTPNEWMGSPRDSSGAPGVYEAAVINTPLLEECARAEDFTGIDILRTIRSFDP